MELTGLKGVGKARAAALNKMGIFSIRDLCYDLPSRYIDLSDPRPIQEAEYGAFFVFQGRLLQAPQVSFPRKGLSITRAYVADGTGKIACSWFNQPYLKNALKVGVDYLFYGKVEDERKIVQNPKFLKLSAQPPEILPVYRAPNGLPQKTFRETVRAALEVFLPTLTECFSDRFRRENKLCGIDFALRNMHYPSSKEALSQAKRRLVFEELFFYQLFLSILRSRHTAKAAPLPVNEGKLRASFQALPYSLTKAQERAIMQIAADVGRTVPMNRLLQGDVGSGKTIVSFYAMLFAVQNGKQAAIMAPTEVLCTQHYAEAKKFFEPLGYRVAMLKSSIGAKERREAVEGIKTGEISVIVGTQALLQGGVEFADLGIVVADEQHRFGVGQRATLTAKGQAPHVLIMSATPIPRTLSLILYGDLDVSIIDELPAGRKAIKTSVVPPQKRANMFAYLREKAKQGAQAYLVTPLVEPGDDPDACSAEALYAQLRKGIFQDVSVGLLHGQMKAADKNEVLDRFKEGEISILISTTVIEVGVNVPNATIMVIMDADRFGLSQLHQLRGRVGRGDKASECYLYSHTCSETAKQRLSILCECTNGFEIAEKDLQLRGPGQFLGNRQHGAAEFEIANIADDIALFQEAKAAVEQAMQAPERESLFAQAKERYQEKMKDVILN